MPGRLTVHFSDRPVRRETILEGRDYVIGRDPACEISIDDPELSRKHARISWSGETPAIEDLGSKNGLSVDGRPVRLEPLQRAAWIGIGNLLARFEHVTHDQLLAEQEAGRKRWEHSLIIRRRLDANGEMDDLLQEALDSVMALSGTSRGFVLLARNDGSLRIASRAGLGATGGQEEPFAGSVSTVNLALDRGTPVVCCDALSDEAMGGQPSVVGGHIRALVCMPLKVMEKTTGVVYADSTEAGKVFTDLDIDILQEMVSHTALVLAAAHLRDELEGLGQILPAIDPERTSPNILAPWHDQIPDARGKKADEALTGITSHDVPEPGPLP